MTKEERENDCFGKLIKKDIPPMSTEQAIEVLHELDGTIYETQQVALDLAIKALEQPTSNDYEYNRGYRDGYDKGNLNGYELRKAEEKKSEDCVSRQAVKEGMIKYGFHAPDMTVTEFIEDELPPVTPTFPKGATNGDMIKAMFPNAEFDNAMPFTDNRWETIDLDTKSKYKPTQLRVYADWWNAPYKRGNEND